MLRKFIVTLFVLAGFILQCSVFEKLAFAGIIPNILIVLTSSFGFMRGEKEGLVIGFFCGMLSDVFFGSFLGFYALVLMYIGYLNGFFRKLFFPEDFKLPMALIAASDFVYNFVIYFFLFLFRNRLDFPYYLSHRILPELVYTLLIMIVLYFIILKINQRLEEIEKRSAAKFV